ncbi:helix-turn-helix domain-containing protein [Subtercola endophyticus]|uniref:helix-turn-helix domain-containing protein n=1 Tax=Subtercola endophyticus TaxID=2895559 RepID=UPI0036F323E5
MKWCPRSSARLCSIIRQGSRSAATGSCTSRVASVNRFSPTRSTTSAPAQPRARYSSISFPTNPNSCSLCQSRPLQPPRPRRPLRQRSCPQSPRAQTSRRVPRTQEPQRHRLHRSWPQRERRRWPGGGRLRLFSVGSLFSEWLSAERLDIARDRITDPAWQSRSIARIAASAGFADVSTFHRAFRQRFGVTPGSLR